MMRGKRLRVGRGLVVVAFLGAAAFWGAVEQATAGGPEKETHMAFWGDKGGSSSVLADKNLREGRAFLQSNGKVQGVITTKSGLQYQVLQKGNGNHPTAYDRVEVHYEGRLINGEVFDSSMKRGKPAVFPLNRVIRGWTEGIPYMRVGGQYRFFIPTELAYGARGAGRSVPANATLIFDVQLLSIK
ncbi:MAG: FKBP-type peptidyl-prolyl cis-trans isomerase [Magnetococcales bacterium]|nr:FKBP-type peptidyl-prolyl cis-trans isomerase [Magnetococcales bacterium]